MRLGARGAALLGSGIAAVAMYAALGADANSQKAAIDTEKDATGISRADAPTNQTTPKEPPATRTATALIQESLGTDLAITQKNHVGEAGSPPKVETLIVTLPDPQASRFASTFDDRLGAVQRAAEAAGYLLDRFSLPWLADRTGARGLTDPGVLLFRSRSRSEPQRFLTVWIVGETPTTGVHKIPLMKALAELAAIHAMQPAASNSAAPAPDTSKVGPKECVGTDPPSGVALTLQPVVRILGPTFSGSWKALDAALTLWSHCVQTAGNPEPQFRIVSGSATAVPPRDASADPFYIAGAPFRATVMRDEDLLASFLQYLNKEQNIPATQVALLVEAETEYGRGLPGARRIPFPLHIAQLRDSSRDETVQDDPNGKLSRRTDLTRLELESERDTMELPAALGKQTGPRADVTLSTALKALAEDNIAYVGLLATDVEDAIVLSRAVRKYVPNAMLFMLNSDLLYLHSDVNSALVGTMLVTSYPLMPQLSRLTLPFSPGGTSLPSSTDRGVGVYNAFLALTQSTQLIGYAGPLEMARSRPAPWLTIVGRNGVWPVRQLERAPGERRTYVYALNESPASASAAIRPQPPLAHAFRLSYIGWCGACLLVLYMLGLTVAGRFAATGGRLRLLISHPCLQRDVHLLGATAALIAVHILMSTVFSISASTDPLLFSRFADEPITWQAVTAIALVLGAIVTVAAAFAAGSAAVSAFRSRKQLPGQGGGTSLMFVVVSAAAAIVMSLQVASGWLSARDVEQVFLVIRSAAWSSGVSPLTPLLFVAVASLGCSVACLRRLHIADERVPQLHSNAPSFTAIETSEARMDGMFRCEVAGLPGFRILVPILLVPWLALFHSGFARPPETAYYELLFTVGFLAVYLGLTMEFARFVFGWIELRGYLRRLAWHPIGDRFVDLKSESSPPPKLTLIHASAPVTVLAWVLGRGRTLVASTKAANAVANPIAAATNTGFTLPHGLALDLDDAAVAVAKAAQADAAGKTLTSISYRVQAHQAITRASSSIVAGLEKGWPAASPAGAVVESGADADARAAAALVAARAVAVLHGGFRQLQNLIAFVTIGLLAMLGAISLYPFQPHGWLLVFNWGVLTTVVAITLVAFIQMDRDRVMSLMTGTSPGSVTFDRDFFLRILLFVLIPLLGLVGANFPAAFSTSLRWLTGPLTPP